MLLLARLAALLACSLLAPACASSWGGHTLAGPVVDGVYTHPSGLFSVWAPYSDGDAPDERREWSWLFHDEGGDDDGFAYAAFGPALRDVSVFGVSVRPADLVAAPRPFDAMDRLCDAHNALYGGTARLLHERVLDLAAGATLFRVYRYERHQRWESADPAAGPVSGHAAYYLQRRRGQDVFLLLDVPDDREDSSVPVAASTLIDQAWDKQRRFVDSVELFPSP